MATKEQHDAMVERLDAEIARLEGLLVESASRERARLWECMKMHRRGDMGPAYIIVNDIEHLFKP